MDQQSTTTPGVRLPQPSLEPMVTQPAMPQYPSQPVMPPMSNPVQTPQMPVSTPINPESAVPVTPPLSAAPNDDTQDEEWVAKAKDITTTYRNDPYMQSKALTQLRAEYLQKQHGMTPKMSEK